LDEPRRDFAGLGSLPGAGAHEARPDQAATTAVTTIFLPAQYEIRHHIDTNPLFRLRNPAWVGEAEVSTYTQGRIHGLVASKPDGSRVIAVPRIVEPTVGSDSILLLKNVEAIRQPQNTEGRSSQWVRPATLEPAALTHTLLSSKCGEARFSWAASLNFQEERVSASGHVDPGMRRAQIGAVHASLAHWTVSDAAATVVMPTGTGKTEVMLALLAATQPKCLLVVVPTDPLRDQIGAKFVTLGLLRQLGVLSSSAQYPVVSLLRHAPRTTLEVDRLFSVCNVVIATAAIAARCSKLVQRKIVQYVSHLFIDEAHHVVAPTWDAFKEQFQARRVLQFTATPFRRDRRPIPGHAIYTYPLRLAQQDGYFKRIRFLPITEFSPAKSDRQIAERAARQLTEDLATGVDHVLLARVDNIKRASTVLGLYQEICPHYRPVAIHTKLPRRDRRAALAQLFDRSSRVIVCVDMLGEGFDLPNLKVAALHDVHASLAVTLQFVGRFTRESVGTVGDATFIANIADPAVEQSLLELYAEDSDWNDLLEHLSEGATKRYREQSALIAGFSEVPPGFPLHAIRPKMSTVVYHTTCSNWTTDALREAEGDDGQHTWITVNERERVVLLLKKLEATSPWTAGSEPKDVTWLLYIAYWAKDIQLLFINCSTEVALPTSIAHGLTGAGTALVSGEAAFRGLHGIKRLTVMNLGVKHALNRGARFTMYAGADVLSGIAQSRLENSIKTNLFGMGYERGGRASLGCSLKGRIWSYKVASDIAEWITWCRRIGPKLKDETISARSVLEHVLIPEEIHSRPDLVPLAVEWPDEILLSNQDLLSIEIREQSAALLECDIQLVSHLREGPLRFRVTAAAESAEYEVAFDVNGVTYQAVGSQTATLIRSGHRINLGEWLGEQPPLFRFEDNTYLHGNRLFRVRDEARQPFERTRINVWHWQGTDIRKESQGATREPRSIQRAVISALLDGRLGSSFDFVLDDDGPGEVADIVAAKVVGDDELHLHFLHCKYSSESQPGARINDLYAVCGQAIKSVPWKGRIERMCKLLGKREAARVLRLGVSGFEAGDLSALTALRRRSRYLNVALTITIVQPGLSAQAASETQLELLAATASYLKETFAADLQVIGSP
jgi:superfamily II DNA or RNA helicase